MLPTLSMSSVLRRFSYLASLACCGLLAWQSCFGRMPSSASGAVEPAVVVPAEPIPNPEPVPGVSYASQESICEALCLPVAAAGMAALHKFYNPSTGLWETTGWWNAANALEATIDYSMLTGSHEYRSTIVNTFEKHKHKNFLNPWLYDDQGWWALAWIKAYDLTGESRYLEMAQTIFKDMTTAWDSTCGGGLWWHKRREYKNAITNELFLLVAVRLHLRTKGTPAAVEYLTWAQREWAWFQQSGMINRENLINDGLTKDCRNNRQTTWSYNQGVILSALVDLAAATDDPKLLAQAQTIADAAIRKLAPKGVLREPCEPDCGLDGPQFKGIFIRNLAYLYQATQRQDYRAFILKNANSIWVRNRNASHQFGLHWEGPFDRADASRQSSAMDAMNAAMATSLPQPTNFSGSEVLPLP